MPFFLPTAVGGEEELHRIAIPSEPGGYLHAKTWWAKGRAPAVVIVHGIAGSKDSHCCVRAGLAIRRSGYHAVRVDMRSAGDSVVDAPSLYHAGITVDLDALVRSFARDPRVSGVYVLGFSGGGSQALKLAGMWGRSAPVEVRGIVTASAPLDYTQVGAHMDRPSRLPYRFYVLRGLLERARRFAEMHPQRAAYRPHDLERIKRFRTFDESIIVPMHGFADVDAYYRDASAGPLLRDVHVPTLVIHAEDDPMVAIGSVRPWFEDASSSVRALVSRHGGHLGFLGGWNEASWTEGWATKQALSFIAERERNVERGEAAA